MKQILAFILFASLFCWLLFSPIYKHVVLTRQAVIQQEVDFLLEVGASGQYGYVSEQLIAQSKKRLGELGFNIEKLQYDITSSLHFTPTEQFRLPRGEILIVEVSYPYENMFLIDALIGIEPFGEHERMRSYGVKMSEYVNHLD